MHSLLVAGGQGGTTNSNRQWQQHKRVLMTIIIRSRVCMKYIHSATAEEDQTATLPSTASERASSKMPFGIYNANTVC